MGEQWKHFILRGSKITADGDCSHEIKRHLVLGRKVTTNVDSILKGRGTRDQIANIRWVTEKAREFQENIYFCFIEIDGETVETVSDFIFGAPKSLQMVTAAMKLKDAYSLKEKL